jgi:hypothetical protein
VVLVCNLHDGFSCRPLTDVVYRALSFDNLNVQKWRRAGNHLAGINALNGHGANEQNGQSMSSCSGFDHCTSFRQTNAQIMHYILSR